MLLIIPLNLLVIASASQSITLLKAQAQASLKGIVDFHSYRLDSRISSANYYLFELRENNRDFQNFSRQGYDNAYFLAKTNLARAMASAVASGEGADGYFICAPGSDDTILILPAESVSGNIKDLSRVRAALRNWLKEQASEMADKWEIIYIEGEQLLVRIYSGEGIFFGMIISMTAMQRDLENAVGFSHRRVIVGAPPDMEAAPSEIAASAGLTKVNLGIMVAVPEAEVMRTLPTTQRLAIILAFGYLGLIPFLLFLLNRMLLRPLESIRKAIVQFKEGQRQYCFVPLSSAEEFRSISQAFNEMADSIEELKVENYEKELARQKMELRNFQMQIHPHFLLNMLHLVYSFAQIGDFVHVQKLTLFLSKYFRYVFRGGKTLEPFELELALIKEYLEISALRYPGAFTAAYDVKEAALEVKVPPLLIHGFIENIIKHALKPGEHINISLYAAVTDGSACFIISDSGTGMDAQTVTDINSGDFCGSQWHDHIGIANASQRLRILLGESSELRVTSAPDEGTEFTVKYLLPEE